jgi:hypothetical protein
MIRRLAAFLAAFCFAALAHGGDEKIPIESFFKISEYRSMGLSPDGKNIAALAPIRGRQGLVIVDIEKRKAAPIASRSDRDIVSVRWINNRRLYYQTGKQGEPQDPRESPIQSASASTVAAMAVTRP